MIRFIKFSLRPYTINSRSGAPCIILQSIEQIDAGEKHFCDSSNQLKKVLSFSPTMNIESNSASLEQTCFFLRGITTLSLNLAAEKRPELAKCLVGRKNMRIFEACLVIRYTSL